MLRVLASFVCVISLVACSGGSGGGGSNRDGNTNPTPGDNNFVYSGPPPQSDEVQSFKLAFYDNLVIDSRCGSCHTPGGESASIDFVNREDVNSAWQSAKARVNLEEPAASPLVEKVASGHQCWLGAGRAETCAVTITAYIENWAAGANQGVSLVSLSPRNIYSPDAELKLFPSSHADAQALGGEIDTLINLLQTNCSGCHNDAVAVPQSPYFASSDSELAYQALKTKTNLNSPLQSRLVQRLSADGHQCWTSSCANDANTMQQAITGFADTIVAQGLDAGLVFSMAQRLDGPEGDGILASSGGRYETDLIAKWEFREGSGSTVADTSGVRPEIELTLSGDVEWMGSGGLRFSGGKAQGGVEASGKLLELISKTGEYSIEAWVAPFNVSQEDAWMMAYSGGVSARNMLASQHEYSYEFYNRSSATGGNSGGNPGTSTENDTTEFAQAALQHVVMTFDPVAGRKIYVNGIDTAAEELVGGGVINNWNQSFAVSLGNSVGLDRPWLGAMRLMAVHNRKLNEEQIQKNFEAGIGEKFYLLFSVADRLPSNSSCRAGDVDYCYVGFEVSVYDDYSYLFNQPFFVNLNPEGGVVEFDLSGIRLGINGSLAQVGQAFQNISASVNSQGFSAINPQLLNHGQLLDSRGTIIPLEAGAEEDLFFLAFDDIDGQTSVVNDGAVEAYAYSLIGTDSPYWSMRSFDAINKSFSEVTGVSSAVGNPAGDAFQNLKSQLPSVNDINAFSAAHQMAVTQLAAVYCDQLASTPALRTAIFGGFNFSAASEGVSGNAWRTGIIDPLLDRAINTGLDANIDVNAMGNEIEELVDSGADVQPYDSNGISQPDGKNDGLKYCDGACPAGHAANVVKGVCIAVLASGAEMIH